MTLRCQVTKKIRKFDYMYLPQELDTTHNADCKSHIHFRSDLYLYSRTGTDFHLRPAIPPL
jgi:hypothetical protein